VIWLNNTTAWTGLGLQDTLRAADNGTEWRRIIHVQFGQPQIETKDRISDKTRSARREAARRRKSEWKVNLGNGNFSRSNDS